MKNNIFLSEPALVCCAGLNKEQLYESCLNGFQGGITPQKMSCCKEEFPIGLIKKELPKPDFPQFGKPEYSCDTRIFRLINAAAVQLRPAVDKALSKYGEKRIGVCFGTCDNGSEASFTAHKAFFENGEFPGDYSLRFQSASFSAEFLSFLFGLGGPVLTVATACASGASAIVRGAELIRAGFCDAVIAGGADVVSQTVFAGFHALEAVSDSLTNPFSKNRKGINLGEAAAFFLLEKEEISDIELLGSGESADAYHMTAPGKDGEGPAKAMKAALSAAQVNSEKIDYVNLHGTGTELNDKAEALAMNAVFSSAPAASSTKPLTGHTLGAAGALEAAICWLSINCKKGLPLHCWDGVKDEEVPFVPCAGSLKTPSICMSNSFAFGGCNVSLILGRRSS